MKIKNIINNRRAIKEKLNLNGIPKVVRKNLWLINGMIFLFGAVLCL